MKLTLLAMENWTRATRGKKCEHLYIVGSMSQRRDIRSVTPDSRNLRLKSTLDPKQFKSTTYKKIHNSQTI